MAHILSDGGVNGEQLKMRRPEAVAQFSEDVLLDVDAIAEAYWRLHRQHKPFGCRKLICVPSRKRSDFLVLKLEEEPSMPFARIDLIKGKPDAYRQAIGEAVYQALLSIGVPENDRFQVINEHESANFIFASSYLGVTHTQDLIMIQITFNEGRTTAQKLALYKAIAEGIHATTGLRTGDIFINLVEVKRENWSFGDGIAQYVSP